MELLDPERTSKTRDEEIFRDFADMIKVNNSGISIEMFDPHLAAELVNDYVKYVDAETISMLVAKVRNTITNQIRYIEFAIGSTIASVNATAKDTSATNIKTVIAIIKCPIV